MVASRSMIVSRTACVTEWVMWCHHNRAGALLCYYEPFMAVTTSVRFLAIGYLAPLPCGRLFWPHAIHVDITVPTDTLIVRCAGRSCTSSCAARAQPRKGPACMHDCCKQQQTIESSAEKRTWQAKLHIVAQPCGPPHRLTTHDTWYHWYLVPEVVGLLLASLSWRSSSRLLKLLITHHHHCLACSFRTEDDDHLAANGQ